MELDDVNTITVLGAGNMGHGIAEVAAIAGYDVYMRDIKEEFVQNGYDQIEWSLGKLAEQDQLSEEEADAALDHVTPVVDMEEACSGTDFLIEAVPEQMDIKKDVYGEVSEYAPEHAVFTTNTSSLSITELSEVTERPERFCGMHFFNPPVRMPLVEVISGAHTAEETLELTEALAEDLDKTPVRVHKDSPGFIVNRILVPLMNEATWLVHDDVATVAEVDSTTKFDIGMPMGAFELADQVGIDVSYHVLDYMHETLGEAYEPCPLLVEKVENDALGKKTGQGFYDYEDGGVDIPTDATSEEVKERLLGVMANETAKLIGNDVANADAIDEAVMLGGGFPDGPAKMADDFGVEALYEALEALHEESGEPRYEPADYLRERAEEGGFHDQDVGTATGEGGFDYDTLEVEIEDQVARIVIDRPHRMNTITPDMLEEFENALERIAEGEKARAILLTGAGDRAFSTGFDASSAAAENGIEAAELSRLGQHVFGRFEEIPLPVVAAVDGYCLGGGMELAASADLRIASERAQFGQPEHNLGLMPGWGGTQRLPRIVGEGRAKEIIFTARNDYGPETMRDYGFVNEVVDTDGFEERAQELVEELASGPPIAQRFTKRAMLAGRDDIDAGLEFEASSFGHLFTTDDFMEGLSAFQSDREPEFEGE